MIRANVIEVERPKRGKRWFILTDSDTLYGPYYSGETARRSGANFPGAVVIEIPGEDDVLTEEKVRDMAKDRASQIITTTNGMVPMFHQDVTNILVAFAKELGVLK